MKTVLLFRTSYWLRNNGQTYDQILSFATSHDWKLQSIEYINTTAAQLWQDTPAPRPKVKKLIELWHPAGCIVEAGGIAKEPWQNEFGNIPIVFIDCPTDAPAENAAYLMSNDKLIAQYAAKELLEMGFSNFAYASINGDYSWDINRRNFFSEIIRQHGKPCTSFTVPMSNQGARISPELAKQLVSLPKPCGIFTANDWVGAMVVTACCEAKINIPNEVAVIGVDNDESICEHLPVTLTSIEQDRANSGLTAAEILNKLMTKERAVRQINYFDVSRIVRRASANGMRNTDSRVADAIELIRKKACHRISPTDVSTAMGCTMRHASRLFSSVRGHSILDEIHLVRLESAKELLRSGNHSVEAIANICGYRSSTDFGRVFKRYTGLPPRDWRTIAPKTYR